MNKKAVSQTMIQNVIFLILGVAGFALIFYFIANQSNNVGEWSDYYVKEIAKVINLAQPGDTVELNIEKLTYIAKKENLGSLSGIFTFDNNKNKVCVKLTRGRRTCYFYYNNVDIVNPEVKLGLGNNPNALAFRIEEKVENDQE